MPLTDAQADRLFDSILKKAEAKLARQIRSNFNNLAKIVRNIIENEGEFIGNVAIIKNQQDLEVILEKAYREAIREAVKFSRRDLELTPQQDDSMIEEVLLVLALWLDSKPQEQARYLTETTLKIFSRSLDLAREKGLSGDKRIKFIMAEFAKKNRGRIGTIATTEAGVALSKGSHTVGQLITTTFIPELENDKILKRWRSQRDSRVRPTHWSADSRYTANPIPIDDFFLVGSGRGLYPRDGNLPLTEIADCRCYLRYVKQK